MNNFHRGILILDPFENKRTILNNYFILTKNIFEEFFHFSIQVSITQAS